MDKIAPSSAQAAAPAASPESESVAVAGAPVLLHRPAAAAADEPVKALSQRAVSAASGSPADASAARLTPANDIDDEILHHPLVDMDEVPMNDTEELARLGGMNLRDERAGDPDLG